MLNWSELHFPEVTSYKIHTLINALNMIFFSYSLLESSHGLTTSQLFVESADQSNTGNYSCSSDAGHSNTTAIHVITGKMIYP